MQTELWTVDVRGLREQIKQNEKIVIAIALLSTYSSNFIFLSTSYSSAVFLFVPSVRLRRRDSGALPWRINYVVRSMYPLLSSTQFYSISSTTILSCVYRSTMNLELGYVVVVGTKIAKARKANATAEEAFAAAYNTQMLLHNDYLLPGPFPSGSTYKQIMMVHSRALLLY